jgi:hypothetical protein
MDSAGHAANTLGSGAAGTSTAVEPFPAPEVVAPSGNASGLVNATAPVLTVHPPVVLGVPSPTGDSGYQAMTSGANSTDGGWIASMLHALNPFQAGSVSVTHLMATSSLALRLALFATIAGAIARWNGGVAGCFNSVRLVAFTHVRLIKCGFEPHISRLVTARAAHPLTMAGRGSRTGSADRAVPRSARSIGITRWLRRPEPNFSAIGPEAGLGGGGGSLIVRIGKLLAAVYAGFLAIWFWATRLRWNGR